MQYTYTKFVTSDFLYNDHETSCLAADRYEN